MILQQTMKKERWRALSCKRKKGRPVLVPLKPGEAYRKRASWLPQQGTIPLDTPIEDCPLTIRAKNCLKACGLWTVEDLTNTTMLHLVGTRNMGKKALDEIVDFLHRFGLSLKDGHKG